MNKSILRNYIIIIIILIIIITSLILSLTINKRNIEEQKIEQIVSNEESNNDLIKNNDIKKNYNAENMINNILIGAYNLQRTMGNELPDIEYEDSEIHKEYIKLLNALEINDKESTFYINSLYKIEINDLYNIYFAVGQLNSSNYESSNNTIFTLVENKETNICTVEIYGENYNDIFKYSDNIEELSFSKEKMKSFTINSETNLYGGIIEDKTSDEDISKWLYNRYKQCSLNSPNAAFEMLDEEYKQQRFDNNINNYIEYLKEYNPIIENENLSQYAKNEMDGYTLYTLVDSSNHSYFAKASNSSAELKYLLDTYTITYDGYNEKYQNMSDSQKAATNMQKFINMINTKDYSHAYEVLDTTFKGNNFGTLDEFKDYVRNNLFENNIPVDSEVVQSDKYYKGSISIAETNDEYTAMKTLNIVMLLKEGTDFVMSFNVEVGEEVGDEV